MAALAGAAGPVAAECSLGQLAEVPVTVQGVPLVAVKINGHEESFAVHSGLFVSTLAATVAQQLKLQTKPTAISVTAGRRNIELRAAEISKFELAGISVPETSLAVAGVFGGESGGKAVGELGEDILGIADVEYDLGHSVIRLMRPTGCGNGSLAYWTKGGATEVPLTHTASSDPSGFDRRILVNVTINGKTVAASLDSTMTRSRLSATTATKIGVANGDQAAGPVDPKLIGRFDSFDIGGEGIRNSRILIGPTGSNIADVILGLDFLLSHRIYVANGQRKIYLTYNGGPVFNLEEGNRPQLPSVAEKAKPEEVVTAGDFFRRGSAEYTRRDLAAAGPDLDKAIALDPSQSEYFYARALLNYDLQKRQGAMADLDKAIQLQPTNFRALSMRGTLYARAKSYDKARLELEAAASLQSPDDRAILQLGSLYQGAEMLDDAISQYDKWLKLHPNGLLAPTALNSRCWVRARQGSDLDKAVSDCTEGLRQSPNAAAIHDSRGLAYLKRGDLDKALADYAAALKANPRAASTLYVQGIAKVRKGHQAEGEADIKAALAIDAKVLARVRTYGLPEAPPLPEPPSTPIAPASLTP